ncbi:hypothetical protein [Spiroplasma tabanidicola]|uniref:Uncharacterized protein n=1 Tax=Spiroplasma tabanidicola TaxID=324079 RepID=A0A6I6C745_9MOLU|nr:hypothetical protein [Spiroplasma tabanidicola]QGS51616.1 hypothetical protein STABA_v1c02490 [Spiroplasma tabanidicola]
MKKYIKKEGLINKVSFNNIIKASSDSKDINMSLILERGMWEMYPIYSNIISDASLTGGKVLKAAEIEFWEKCMPSCIN